ncbi:hypothetical protein VMCG_00835 [Cytospora schulzeri]|uniref:Hypervirulence associated protein TUDOR domain-containing protein n=1 Tax=Cytospora schulzeri TaxID=448051 RepID=A0A423X7T6_9PEZI|nr:hypothetical protein VMCG_00835 [Valsa malicola]
MKEDREVITEFNEYVNVTASELDKWLKSDDSSKAGWHKDGGDGESVGQESGHKIVEILKSNPDKDPEKYTDDQIQHMRKVASYCKRHLAQESKGLKEKDVEDAKKTKSYISLMNWGHDPLRALGREEPSSDKGGSKSNPGKRKAKEEGLGEEDEEDGEDKKEDEDEQGDDEAEVETKRAGDKRKNPAQHNGANKKRETRQSRSSRKDNDEEEEDGEGAEEDDDYEEDDGNDDSGGKPSKNGPKKGDTVSWKWGSGHPHGVVLDVQEGDATITTKRGNEISRKGKPEDPAVILDAGKSKAIKLAHELD